MQQLTRKGTCFRIFPNFGYFSQISALAVLAALGLFAGRSDGAVTITIAQDGPNVVMSVSGSGSLQTGAWDPVLAPFNEPPGVEADAGILIGDPGETLYDIYIPNAGTNFQGPSSMGGGSGSFSADSGNGETFGLAFDASSFGATQALVVPFQYTSGTSLDGRTSTFLNQTIGTGGLGLTPGTYTWSWGNDPVNEDSFTVIVVPEPSSLMLCLGACGAALLRRRRTA